MTFNISTGSVIQIGPCFGLLWKIVNVGNTFNPIQRKYVGGTRFIQVLRVGNIVIQ